MKQWRVAWRNLMRRKWMFLTFMSISDRGRLHIWCDCSCGYGRKIISHLFKGSLCKGRFQERRTEAYFSEDVYQRMSSSQDYTAVSMLKESMKVMSEEEGVSDIQKRVVVTGYSQLDTAATDFKVIDGDLKAGGAVITDRTAKVWGSEVGDTISFGQKME